MGFFTDTGGIPIQIFIMYALLIPCAAVFIFIKSHSDNKPTVWGTVFKTLSIWIIIVAALVSMLGVYGSVFSVIIISGLVMGLAGDVALSLPDPGLKSGMGFFGLGHICYIAALIVFVGFSWYSFLVFAVIYAGLAAYCLLVLRKKFNFGEVRDLIVPAVIYSIIITYMVSMAVLAPFYNSRGGLVLIFAGVLFAVSDGLLAYNLLAELSEKKLRNGLNSLSAMEFLSMTVRQRGAISLTCYFAGQSLFAVSLFI